MPSYIDADSLKQRIIDNWYTADDIIVDVDREPTADVVKVVRCKDCKWSVEHYDTDGNVPYWVCKNWDGGTDADGFCYEGERREEDE